MSSFEYWLRLVYGPGWYVQGIRYDPYKKAWWMDLIRFDEKSQQSVK